MTTRPVLAALVVGVCLLTAACNEVGDPTANADPVCDFSGSTSAPEVEPVGGPFEIVEVDHEVVQAGCEETVTFSLGSLPDDAKPGYHVFYRDTPLRGPDGQEVDVRGDVVLEIVLFGASGATAPAVADDAGLILDIVKPPEVPGGSLWLVGLDEQRPFTVRVDSTTPATLVVSVGD